MADLGRDSFGSSNISKPSAAAYPPLLGDAREVIRMDEPGPCGRRLSIKVSSEVEVAFVTIPRRAHMWRRSAAEGERVTAAPLTGLLRRSLIV